MTLEIVQLLHNTLGDDYGSLPIHRLCTNGKLDDTNSIDILRFMLDIDPTLSREVNGDDWLPIHHAAQCKSTAFCKELIDAYPESLRIESRSYGWPIHLVCRFGNRVDTTDTIQYMLELDPELINAEDSDGYLPIHFASEYSGTELIELLFKYDPEAASTEMNDEYRWLPLHLACSYNTNLSTIQVLYDAYPEAILARDRFGDTPLDLARSEVNQPAIDFVQTQLVYARQAQDMTVMTTVDENGWLSLHCALKDNASLGSIKLLVRGNQTALQVADQNGVTRYILHANSVRLR